MNGNIFDFQTPPSQRGAHMGLDPHFPLLLRATGRIARADAQPAAPAAPADAGGLAAVEQVDLGAVTCAQALADEKLFNTAMLWADGYAHGRLGRPRTLGRELIDHKPELVTLCQRDTSRRLVEAVVQINRRPRR